MARCAEVLALAIWALTMTLWPSLSLSLCAWGVPHAKIDYWREKHNTITYRMITKPNFILIWSAANGGLRGGGLNKFEDIWGKRPLFCIFWIFQVLFGPSGKGRKRQKKGEKAGKGWFSGANRHPLNPHLLHPHVRQPNYLRIFLFCDYQTELFLDLAGLGKKCEQWIAASLGLPYRNYGGILFGKSGGGITEQKLFWNYQKSFRNPCP